MNNNQEKEIMVVLKSIFPIEKIEKDSLIPSRYDIISPTPNFNKVVDIVFNKRYADIIFSIYTDCTIDDKFLNRIYNDTNLIITDMGIDNSWYDIISINLNSFNNIII